ncbi:anti-anti-sigma factor [Lentzea atacamensis]|uniref:Anti-anti-sigma factor n=2 Tax=Lentzea TaxID=165301 RepID=A0A316HV91_9PSEU|nr:STAS domain-containing protein [Lentzea atacamensis]PWK84638.1 anti-anti-sigma factor [Lentzea atacamensis]RAS59197.1 anti-anti-sigma factor [Lentzea atacamensis]
MEPEPGLLEVRRHGAVVTLVGEVDLNTSELLKSELALACASGDGAGDVVIDFSALTFIGSSGLHVLIETATALGERRLVLLGGGWAGYVVNLLDLTVRFPNIVVGR